MGKLKIKSREGFLPLNIEQLYLNQFSVKELIEVRSRAIETLRLSQNMEPQEAAQAWAEAFLHALIKKGLLVPLEVYEKLKSLEKKTE